jgi:hypothetical protein
MRSKMKGRIYFDDSLGWFGFTLISESQFAKFLEKRNLNNAIHGIHKQTLCRINWSGFRIPLNIQDFQVSRCWVVFNAIVLHVDELQSFVVLEHLETF